MVKVLNRDKIQRMVDYTGGAGTQSGSGGGGEGVSQAWVNANFVSIAYFEQLFKAYKPAEQTGDPDVEVKANTIDEDISNIKAMKGFWTEQFISALGQGSGGGGGGGASALTDLVDVSISSPSSGQVLMYDGNGHWINGSISMSGYATQTWVQQQGYLSATSAAETYLPKTDAASTYLSKTDAASTYLSKTDAQTTYLSKTDAANTYLSIAFFGRLFQAYNGSTAVNPNDTSTTIDNIKAMFGFWTEQYISALGQGSGGGGGGASALGDLVDVIISSPSSGQVLMYDGNGHWINGSISMSGYATQTWVQQQGYLPATTAASTYLPLAGGTMTGLITRDAGGAWISGRDNAIIKTTRTSIESADWHPAVAIKTSAGCWTFGSVGGESLMLSYDTDENYNLGNNTNAVINFPAAGSTGTLALTSDILTALSDYAKISLVNGRLSMNDDTNGDNINFNTITYDTSTGIVIQPLHVPNYSGCSNYPFNGYGTLVTFSGNTLFPFQLASNQRGELYYRADNYQPNQSFSFIDSTGWVRLIDSSNIGSQSVNYASSAGNAGTLGGTALNGLFTDLSNTNDGKISMTIGGVAKTLTVSYASNSGSATCARNIYDSSDNTPISVSWSESALSSASYLCAWDGYHIGNIAASNVSVGSAAKLTTSRTIWGQPFDGSGNVTGNLKLGADNYLLLTGSSYGSGSYIIGRSGGIAIAVGGASYEKFAFYQSKFYANAEIEAETGVYSHGYVTALSDVRLKKIIDRFTLKPEAIALASLIHYTWKKGHDDSVHVGGIAQEWQEILPEAVHDIDGRLTMDYGVIGMVSAVSLAKTVIEQEKRIKSLEERLAAIEAKLQ